jgi:hypothetical protein
VTISGGGFDPTENAIYFGQGYIPSLGSTDGATPVFVVPATLEPACRYASPPCRSPSIITPPGSYEVAIATGNDRGSRLDLSNRLNFTVIPTGEP